MQYTLRNVGPSLDAALRRRAKEQGISLNEALLGVLTSALGLGGATSRCRDLSDVAGTWIEDPAVEASMEAQRHIDQDPWR